MSTRHRKKSIVRPLLLPLVALAFSAYFAWHGWHGAFGIEARRVLDGEAARLETIRAELKSERTEIEKRVALLRPQSLESDMLDERARSILGFAQPTEIVIYKPGPQAAVTKK